MTQLSLRAQVGRFIARGLRLATRLLGEPRVIMDREGISPYLSRWYILGRPRDASGSGDVAIDEHGNPAAPVAPDKRLGIFIHRFHRSDQDLALHNHPWTWAIALVFAGGYSEERRQPDKTVSRADVLPLSVNRIGHDTFHRVDLIEADAWSIFITGPRVSDWSFWDRDTGVETPWREFLAKARA